jgi:hypothetical protein
MSRQWRTRISTQAVAPEGMTIARDRATNTLRRLADTKAEELKREL